MERFWRQESSISYSDGNDVRSQSMNGKTSFEDEQTSPDFPKNSTSELLFAGKFLMLKKNDQWEYVERDNASGIVAIMAITENHEIILVEQFRVPVNRRVIEIPAGLVGDVPSEEHERFTDAAHRELLEETGYVAERLEYLTEGPSSAGLSTEVITFFRAVELRKVSEGGGDGLEKITVHRIPLDELTPWLDSKRQDGCFVDYKIFAALYLEMVRENRLIN